MANSIATYHASAGQRDFTIPFPYLKEADVMVSKNNSLLFRPLHYHIISGTTVRLSEAAQEGDVIEIRRQTESDTRLVDFQNGAVLTEEELDLANVQNFYLIQELQDKLASITSAAFGSIPQDVLEAIAQEVLSQEVALELQQRISDIDAAGQELINQALQLNLIGEPAEDFSVFKFRTGTIQLNETGITLEDYFSQLEDADSSLAEKIALLGAANAEGTAFVLNADTVLVNSTESLATRLNQIGADLSANQAAITAEQSARASADSALASDITTLTARVDTNEDAISDVAASIVAEQTARANGDNALASQLSALTARVDTNEDGIADNAAAIASEQSARASADSALASDISSLQATVNGHSATITTLSSVQAAMQGDVAALEARYGVTLNVNGYITGFTQFNDGQTGTFAILADKFFIVDPENGGQNPKTVFGIQNGVVVMQNVVIGDALIQNLTVGKLTTGTLNADILVGSGKIVWDNGTYMKVAGVGFGTNNQFIEWFGPKMPIEQCSEATAISYLKTNGDAYFGGSLHAGTLTTSGTTTDTSATASIEIGPFGSDGGTIQVTYSYTADGASSPGVVPEVDFYLDQAVGAGAYVTVAEKHIVGSGGLDPFGVWLWAMSGTFTYTDNLHTISNRKYRARIQNRVPSSGAFNQRITVISTEE